MSELELYKFIIENNVEYHWQDNDGIDDVLIFLEICNSTAYDFTGFLDSHGYTFDDVIKSYLKKEYLCIWMNEICNHYGININNVFERSEG